MGASVSADLLDDQRTLAATACRVLASRGLAPGILGHVSVRVGDNALLVRGRGQRERGVARTEAADVRLVDLDGRPLEPSPGWAAPAELPIHTAILRHRPDWAAVVHAHPPASVLCGLAGLELRPVFGAFNIPAMRLALDGVGVYPRPVLIRTETLAEEMLAALGDGRVCLLRGHVVVAVGETLQQATVAAVNLNELCSVTLELARLGATPPVLSAADLAELPDLGGHFNDELMWRSLVADLGEMPG
jgi:ribulose-5-phosphate 4-epimerase/fuculose-1-phosphate aldolase